MRQSPFAHATTYRLGAGAVECDQDGPRVAGVGLLRRAAGARERWSVPPLAEIEAGLSRAYGWDIAAASKLGGLRVVADALNKGELARAQIATLLLRLPAPPPPDAPAAEGDDIKKRLRDSGLLKDWDPDAHPRTGVAPNPGWFAPNDDAGAASSSMPKREPASASDGESKTEAIPICIAEGASIATDEFGNKLSSCHYVCFGGGSFHKEYRGGKGCPPVLRPNFLD